MTFRAALLAAAAALTPLPTLAEWTIDPAHTSVSFTVDHLGFSEVKGLFRAWEAEVAFDPEDLAATAVTFTIDAASVDTLWPERDAHIRSEAFLDVANHPEIVFVSTSVETTGDTTAVVTGDLTIRGETRPVRFEATLNDVGPNPFLPEQRIAGFTLTGEIDRTAFGIDFGAPAIGAVLPVTINAELVQGG